MFSLVATTFLVSKKTMTSAHAVSRVFFLEQRRRVACHFIKNKKETEGRQEPLPAQVQRTPPKHTTDRKQTLTDN